jgi:hypothetical protein
MSSLHALHQERLDYLLCTNEEELRLDLTRISTLADRALIGESDSICCKELTEAHISTWGNTQSGVVHVVSFGARVIVALYFSQMRVC